MLKPEIYLVLIISVITLFNESYAKGGKGGMNTGVRIYNINGPKSLNHSILILRIAPLMTHSIHLSV